jgi:hypothetical protein
MDFEEVFFPLLFRLFNSLKVDFFFFFFFPTFVKKEASAQKTLL